MERELVGLDAEAETSTGTVVEVERVEGAGALDEDNTEPAGVEGNN
jgi:hypothetical protein